MSRQTSANARDNEKLLAENRKARFDFEITDTLEAGMVLLGSEVKSIKSGQMNLKDSYVVFQRQEAFLIKSHVSPYKQSSSLTYDPERSRKLLLHRHQLDKWARAVDEKGFTCVPLRVVLRGGVIKIDIGLAKGKQKGDKREATKKKDLQRELAQVTRHRQKGGR